MLVLKRRIGETFMVGDAAITILSSKGNQVKVGIISNGDVGVYREEVYIKMKKELEQKL